MFQLALAALTVFVAALACEHIFEPQLSPARHMVSEYVRTSSGAVAVAGFAAWALALALTTGLLWHGSAGRRVQRVQAACFAAASVGVLMLAAFETQTSAGRLPSGERLMLHGRLHDLGSGAASLALLFAASLGAVSPAYGRRLRRWSLIAVLLAVSLSTALMAAGDSVGGARQRGLLAIAVVWHVALLVTVMRRPQQHAIT